MYKNKSKDGINFKVFTYDISDIFYKKDNINYLEYFPIGIKKSKNIYRNFITDIPVKNNSLLRKMRESSFLICDYISPLYHIAAVFFKNKFIINHIRKRRNLQILGGYK